MLFANQLLQSDIFLAPVLLSFQLLFFFLVGLELEPDNFDLGPSPKMNPTADLADPQPPEFPCPAVPAASSIVAVAWSGLILLVWVDQRTLWFEKTTFWIFLGLIANILD